MAINKNSNVYTIIYTVVMVVIVGALLAFLATSLKEKQDANVLNDQKFSIMKAFGAANDKSDKAETIKLFKENVTIGEVNVVKVGEEVTATANWLDSKSETYEKDEDRIFTTLGDRKKLSNLKNNYPIFKYAKDGETLYVLPMTGAGLWGDIWGYVAVKANAENKLEISGIVMAHAGETPGLGAEIATQKVQDKFVGKSLYDAEGAFAVEMVKGMTKKDAEADASKVDAITGGTKTCDGVNLMLKNSIGNYEEFLKSLTVSTSEDTTEKVESTEDENPENVEPINVEE